MSRIILKAADLDGYLSDNDFASLNKIEKQFNNAIEEFKLLSDAESGGKTAQGQNLIDIYNNIGKNLQEIISREDRIHVYSFSTSREHHGEASRIIAKLRNTQTQLQEFVYYIQRAYELLFKLAFGGLDTSKKNYIFIKTPVTVPVQSYAVHKIPNVDDEISDSVMCVMLRGALLPSMIMSKEIQDYSSDNYVTPFALFKIKRDDSRKEHDMEYILDLNNSFFDLDNLNSKTLIFADPMNATGGSLVTIVKYLHDQGVKPKAIKFINVISALKGALRIVRAIDNVNVYTLWIDPVLNELAYILPGLGDAGDRLNGPDTDTSPRNIIQLLAGYGSNITSLYRVQLRKIEETVLGGSEKNKGNK